ncbi:MAG TPA: hypothetical protein VGC95_10945, partial [Chitinophagaceae bacterium]
MDANSFYEQHRSAEQAFDELCMYRDVIQRVGGTMITIWHNHFLGTAGAFQGWKAIYQRFFETMS